MSDIRTGDCLDVFAALPEGYLDALVTDPPAGVSFMSRTWDRDHGGRDAWVAFWAARFAVARRACKPGAYALVWALPRTSHWTATALEDGGWFVQDVITHHFGQGWPKGRSALKPASEHWILARNGGGGALQIDACRVARGAGDVSGWSVAPGKKSVGGMLNVTDERRDAKPDSPAGSWPTNLALSHCPDCEERGSRRVKGTAPIGPNPGKLGYGGGGRPEPHDYVSPDGTETVPAFACAAACACGATTLAPSGGAAPRCACGAAMWWACPVAQMDAQSCANGMHSAGSASTGISRGPQRGNVYAAHPGASSRHGDTENGSAASRFFPRFTYQAKASGGERHAGCEHLYWRANGDNPFGFDRVTREAWEALAEADRARGNVHPTVKSLALMEWLVALVTPPGGRVGDLTAGSGGTGIAVARMNAVATATGTPPMSFIGAELCPEAVEIAEARLRWWQAVRHDTRPAKVAESGPAARQASLFGGRL